jgi:hypothetical protein
MKNSTALKQSRASVRFLSVAVPIAWGLFIWLRWVAACYHCRFYVLLSSDGSPDHEADYKNCRQRPRLFEEEDTGNLVDMGFYEPNYPPAPNRRQSSPLGGWGAFVYRVCAPLASPAAAGEG